MMRLAAFLITFCAISPVWALTCKTDGSGGCAGTAAVAADCASLGFKKEDVAGCKHYLYCPFDQNYKACVAKEDTPPADECTDYPLTRCPTGATSCTECQSGGTTKYKVNSCKNGYHLSGNTCIADSCSGYPLDSCPTGATSCTECQSGTTTKYKIDSCKSGYTLNGNTCVSNTCTDYPLDSCPTGAVSCSECQSGDTTKYKVNNCKSGYTMNGNTCVANACTDYPLDICPTDSNCSECQSGDKIKYKFDSCKVGYGKTVKDCGTWSIGWTLGTLNSSGCGKCIKKSCPSGSATTAAGCASGVITDEGAYAYSGDDMCKVCQTGPSPTCSDGYAMTDGSCPDPRLQVVDKTQKDAAGCYKCVMKTCSYYGLEPMSSPLVNDGYHLCKQVQKEGLTCQECVSCNAATNCNPIGGCDWRMDAASSPDISLCSNSSFNGKELVRVRHPGIFSDDNGHKSSSEGCFVLDFTIPGHHAGESLGCCQDGRFTTCP